MPVVKRRRTRSRRTTRRLHRTRRQRGGQQFEVQAQDTRIDLEKWKSIADEKKTIENAKDSLDILRALKDSRLEMTDKTAPDISLFTIGKPSSVEGIPPAKTGQTLLSAISNILIQTGEETFSNPTIFKEKMNMLKNLPVDEFYQGKDLYQFIEQLESFLRESKTSTSPTPVDITNTDNYPLYIWFAAANIDRSELEETSLPVLEAPSPLNPESTAVIPVVIPAAPAQPGL